MIDTEGLIEAAKSHQAIPSDYALAKLLGVTPSLISGYHAGRSRPDDEMARRIAELANLDPGYVVACLHAERAKTDETRAVWQGIAKRLQHATAAGLAMVILSAGLTVSPDASAMGKAYSPVESRGGMYIM